MQILKTALIIFITSFFSFARETTKSSFINVGGNLASFRQEGGQSFPAIQASLGIDFSYNDDSGFWGYEFGFTREFLGVRNKTWPTDLIPPYFGVETGNIDISIYNLDFMLRLGRAIRTSRFSAIKIFFGPALSLPVSKELDFDIISMQDLQENEAFDFDYLRYDADPGPAFLFIERGMHPKFCAVAGISFFWRKIYLGFSYWHALNKSGDLVGLTLFDKIDRKMVRLGIAF